MINCSIDQRGFQFHINSDDIQTDSLKDNYQNILDKNGTTPKNRTFYRSVIKLLVLFTLLLLVCACDDSSSDDDDELVGNWFELSDFEGVPRSDAVAFTIGSKGYVGVGYDGSDRLNDFWEYDPQLNNWSRKADFPGTARNGAVGFGTDSKGYIGTGYDGTSKLNDFWEYDPASDTWVQIPDFGGSARYGAIAFAINNKGYVGTGYDGNCLKDLWEYDPSTSQWTQKISLGGGKRRDAVAFVIDEKGYVCTGVDNAEYEDDFWEYDPVANQWSEMRSLTDVSDDDYDDYYTSIVGTDKVVFSISGKGYLVTGGKSTTGYYVWEYDPLSDLWEQKTSLEASARLQSVGFSIGDIGYITTGKNSSYYFDDLWGFDPIVEQVDLDKKVIVAP